MKKQLNKYNIRKRLWLFMNLISYKYLAEVYSSFPVVGISELFYLIKLKHNITEYIFDNNSLSLDEIYLYFGKPEDIVRSYFSITDIDYIIKKMQTRRFIRNSIVIFSLIATVAFFSFQLYTIKTHEISKPHLHSYEYSSSERKSSS